MLAHPSTTQDMRGKSQETVSDHTLHYLQVGEIGWQQGVMSPACQAMLVMILPDICGELLQRRADAARLDPGIDSDQGARIEGLSQHCLDHLVTVDVMLNDVGDRLNRIEAAQSQILTEITCLPDRTIEEVAINTRWGPK